VRRVMRCSAVVAMLLVVGAPAVGADDPPSLAMLDYMAHRNAPTSPDLLGAANETPIPLPTPAGSARPCATVFGYLPYWESAQYLRYDLLTHVACFSVEVNSDGTLGNSHGWPWTAVINAAHSNGVKVILVATLMDGTAIDTLITNPTYTNRFFENIKAKMIQGSADGLNIDFESSADPWKAHINAFMADLTAYMHAALPGCEVTFAGPAVNWRSAFDLLGLANSCDGIFIMGYAFAGSWSTTTGPNAPLTGGSINITNTVLTQYAAVTQSNPRKLILGVPYYGGHWTTTSAQPRAAVTAWIGSTRFRDDEGNAGHYGVLWDTVSQTPWYRWNDGQKWHQVWYDNAQSLGLKYDLAENYGLQGVGMWALGYDGSRSELWDELARHFGPGCLVASDFDADRDVDLSDFAFLQVCFNGPNRPWSRPDCSPADLDGDGDVDLADFSRFQSCFRGPNRPPACR